MIRRAITHSLCAAALCMTVVTPVVAADTPTGAAAPSASADGIRLASLVVPYDLFLKSNTDSFLFGFNETVKKDPNAAELFRVYPGLREALVTAQLDALKTMIAREHGVLLGLVGRHNDLSYTKSELSALNTYFASPIGKRLIAAEYSAVDQQKMLDALSGDDAVLTKEETADLAKDTPARIFNSLSKAEQAEASRFWGSPLGRKVNANGPKVQEISRVWLNDLNASNLKQVEALSIKIVREFIEKGAVATPAT